MQNSLCIHLTGSIIYAYIAKSKMFNYAYISKFQRDLWQVIYVNQSLSTNLYFMFQNIGYQLNTYPNKRYR